MRLFQTHVGKFYSSRIVKVLQTIPIYDLINKIPFLPRILSKYLVKIGHVGQADLNGIILKKVTFFSGQIKSIGIRIEIEVKTGDACQTPEQKNWQRMIERFGGIYIVARSVEQAISDINEKLGGYDV